MEKKFSFAHLHSWTSFIRLQEMLEQPTDLEHFHRSTDLNFAMIRAKTGRVYYVNPYYIAAWSNVFQVSFLLQNNFS